MLIEQITSSKREKTSKKGVESFAYKTSTKKKIFFIVYYKQEQKLKRLRVTMKNITKFILFLFILSSLQLASLHTETFGRTIPNKSYDICMPTSDQLTKEDIVTGKITDSFDDEATETSASCSPYYHYGWLLLFIIVISVIY